jgi:PAS domain S-box-containing protein
MPSPLDAETVRAQRDSPMPAPSHGRHGGVASWLGGLAAALGGLVLIGWLADIPSLRSLLPHQVETKANAAICLVLGGVALVSRARRCAGALADVASGLMVLTGLATLLQYMSGRDWGIDELLIRDTAGAVDTVHPGRMAPPTALNFVLLGAALLFTGTPRKRLAAMLAATATVIAALAFAGNLYDVSRFASFGPYTAMAAPSGIAFLLLGAGVLFVVGDGMVAHMRQSALVAGFVFALLLLGLMAGAVLRNTQLFLQSNRRVVHTHQVVNALTATFSAVQDAETGARGYLLAGNRIFLETHESAPATTHRLLGELRGLVADNPAQLQRLGRLEIQVAEKLSFAADQVGRFERGDVAAAHAMVTSGEGKRRMDAVRATVAEMTAAEEAHLHERLTAIETSTDKTVLSLGLGLTISVAVLLVVFVLLRREIHTRTRLAMALRRSEESQRVTLQSIGDGVLATDTAGRVTLMNPVAEQLTGWSLAEARGRPVEEVFNIISESTRQPAVIPVKKVLATGEIQELANHTALIARNGAERSIADSAAPIRDDGGRLLGVVLVFRDVTEAAAARKSLHESETRYRTLFESIEQGLCIIEMLFDEQDRPVDYRFLEVNPAFEKHTGLKDAVGRRMKELAPIEQEWVETLARVGLTGEPVYYQNRAAALDRAFDIHAFRFGDPARRQVAVLFSNITERYRAQAELDRFFQLSLDFLCIASADGTFRRASPGITEILGWSVEEFLAQPYLEQVHPDDREATRREVERQLASGEKVFNFENRYRHKDGSWRTLSWRSTPYGDLMYATARDVTEARRAEQQVITLNRVLSQHAAQLEAANKELESFSYSVSHDLRAPLRHVQGYVGMLTREAGPVLSEKAQHYLKTIADAGREMGELIDDLLAFSRMGRTEMREQTVDLAAMVEDVRAALEPAGQGRDIRWTIGLLPAVRGDSAMLRMVLMNLLGNAVKYTRKRATAEIEIACIGGEEGRLVFRVKDNGAGFDMKYADKLFGVFQRLHRADEFEGTGIGLASVRRIIVRHGGRVWAEAQVDGGASFHFTLQSAHPQPL